METIETIIGILVALPLLAAVGITTVAAFAIMAVLGLLTEFSFKRIFFVSYGVALLAPLIAMGALFSTIGQPGFQQDVRNGVDQLLEIPDDPEAAVTVGPLIPGLRKLGADIRENDLSEAEIERRVEALIEGSSAEAPSGNVPQITQDVKEGEDVTVKIDGAQLSVDGDTVRIQID